MAGGNNGQDIISDLLEISLSDYQIKYKKQMSFPRDELALVLGKNKKFFYAIGGYSARDERCLNEVERYDIEKDLWEPVASMNNPRRALSAVRLKNGIFAIGGFDGEKYLSSVEIYDETLNDWKTVCFMNIARCLFTAMPS